MANKNGLEVKNGVPHFFIFITSIIAWSPEDRALLNI